MGRKILFYCILYDFIGIINIKMPFAFELVFLCRGQSFFYCVREKICGYDTDYILGDVRERGYRSGDHRITLSYGGKLYKSTSVTNKSSDNSTGYGNCFFVARPLFQ